MDEKIYKIGDYEFETLREYRQAQEDLKKIKYITDELDIYDNVHYYPSFSQRWKERAM